MNTSGRGVDLHLRWKTTALKPVSLTLHWLLLTQRERCHLQSQQHQLLQQHTRAFAGSLFFKRRRVTWPCLWAVYKSKHRIRWQIQNKNWKEKEEKHDFLQLKMLHPRARNQNCSFCCHYVIPKLQGDSSVFPLVASCPPPANKNKIFYRVFLVWFVLRKVHCIS